MDCPACKEAMVTLEYQYLEIDLCLSCQGVWLDKGEWASLTGNATAESHDFSPAPTALLSTEGSRRCPICRRPMDKQIMTATPSLVIDVCRHGHGFWFDKGELLKALDNATAPGSDNGVAKWLREVFAAELSETAAEPLKEEE